MKDLKELLGEDLWLQVEPKLKGQGINGKDLNLVATNTGEFVPAEKYDTLKAEALKYKTDYETLNGKYEVDMQNAVKASNDLLKRTIVSQALSNANVAKINNGYDAYFDGKVLDVDKLSLNGTKIDNLDGIVSEFTKSNPQLVIKSNTTVPTVTVSTQSTTTEPVVSIPATTGLNPQNSQNAVKDSAYYKTAIANAQSFDDKMALMVEAEKNNIEIK